MNKKLFIVLNVILLCFSMFASLCAQAQNDGSEKLDKPIPAKNNDIGSYTNSLFKFGIMVCVLTAAIYIGIGAFNYFAAAGNASMAEKGKEIIQRSIIGLVLALVAWIIISTVSTQFVNLEVSPLPAR